MDGYGEGGGALRQEIEATREEAVVAVVVVVVVVAVVVIAIAAVR